MGSIMWQSFFVFALAVCHGQENDDPTVVNFLPVEFAEQPLGPSCFAQRESTIQNRSQELDCCRIYHETFSAYWYLGGMYLTEYLQTLNVWSCPQFSNNCENRTFDFTEFSANVYKRACDYSSFVNDCYSEVKAFVNSAQQTITSNVTIELWNNISVKLGRKGTRASSTSPCVQVAYYDQGEKFGQYLEVVTYMLPFCGIVWCGVGGTSESQSSLSYWNCMDTSCRTSVIACIVLIGVLAFGTTALNACVIAVFYFNKTLLNSQGFYKLSLAIADLLVGAIVLPSFGYVLHTIATHKYQAATFTSYEIGNFTYQIPAGHFSDIKFGAFGKFVGFFTSLSLCVSINSLMLASMDRLSVVRSPLKYNADVAKDQAWKLVLLLWVLAALFSSLPLYVVTLRYSMISSVMFGSAGPHALYLYLITFLVPFLVTWGLTVATCCYTFSHARDRNASEFSMEINLTKTLMIMVGVFTISLTPTILSVIGSLFLNGIYYYRPESVDRQLAAAYVSFEFVSILMLVSNSSWNFFVYNARNQSFRTGSRSVVTSLFDVRSLVTKARRATTSGTAMTSATTVP